MVIQIANCSQESSRDGLQLHVLFRSARGHRVDIMGCCGNVASKMNELHNITGHR